MQDHCVNSLHASCVGVVTFPTSTSNGSGNPDNCGEACNCKQSSCGPVAVPCDDVQCQGAPEAGAVDQSIGSCKPALGADLGGCPCTVSV